MKKKEDVRKDVLFEIGTEELPATNLADIFESEGVNALESKLRQCLETARIGFKECRVQATCRRLVFSVTGAEPSQRAKENRVKLLWKQEAYDDAGKPTDKLSMILKHRNLSAGDLIVADLNGRECVFATKQEPVRNTASVLPEIFESLLRSLPFPKTMRWDDSGLYFPRPIRSAMCLYGSKPLRFKIGNVRTEGTTPVFSKACRTSFVVKDTAAYAEVLKKRGVIVDPVARKKIILESLERLAKSAGGRLYEDRFLLNEVNFLVENPHAFSAPFDAQFLALPLEVLAVSMARKQRIFSLLDKQGKVMPLFLAVMDGSATEKEKKKISVNYEHILHAKLQDSLFFYREDLKVPLSKKREELGTLIFLKGAGSMLERSERLTALAKKIGHEAGLDASAQKALERASFLAKADLLTHMVGEFPELQGVIGKYYARENGEDTDSAEAIGEQYLPRVMNDALPRTLPGALLSILDKADLITACFGLGLEPTSSLDPYALRRSATGILKIMLDKKLELSIPSLLEHCIGALARTAAPERRVELPKKLENFFKERFKSLLVERGYREDVIQAALSSRFERPYEAFVRVDALTRVLDERKFADACKVVERTSNILKGTREALPERIDPAVFTEPLESQVFSRYEQSRSSIENAQREGDVWQATSLYADAFFVILGEFFDKVFINAEDMAVRRNRLALLKAIKELYTRDIADLSKIQTGIQAK